MAMFGPPPAPDAHDVLHCALGGESEALSEAAQQAALFDVLERLGPREKVLLVPPDFTRYHSNTGPLTRMCHEFYGDRVTDVLPALGTHAPMTPREFGKMYAGVPFEKVRVHDWRNDVETIAEVPAARVREASDGHLDEPYPVQLNRLVWSGGHDLIISLGQVVPHEVLGMANYNKNLFVGVGGAEAINLSHFIGATYGMERMMGLAWNPLRAILEEASKLTRRLPVLYVLTVVGRDDATGGLATRGLFIGTGYQCFGQAAALSLQVNFEMLPTPLEKVVVFLDPEKFHSTWLGNKAIYRTRMAIADGGELIILAPGVERFGEDGAIDLLIRDFGYRTTPETMANLQQSLKLRKNLSAAAHLIHGSSEDRFRITYCPGGLSREEVESVGYGFADVAEMLARYDPAVLRDGWNEVQGERIFFVSNPAIGLWAARARFEAR